MNVRISTCGGRNVKRVVGGGGGGERGSVRSRGEGQRSGNEHINPMFVRRARNDSRHRIERHGGAAFSLTFLRAAQSSTVASADIRRFGFSAIHHFAVCARRPIEGRLACSSIRKSKEWSQSRPESQRTWFHAISSVSRSTCLLHDKIRLC